MLDLVHNTTMTVHSPAEMMELGKQLGAQSKGGDFWGLVGDLGAGKTHFVKGFATGVGCDKEVSSPSFPLVHEYHGGRLSLYHFDFYRLDEESELYGIGWDEYAEEGGVILAEWANKFPEALPEGTKWIHFRVVSETERILTLHDSCPL